MNFVECLRAATVDNQDGQWFRPTQWAKSGMAFCIADGQIKQVPTARGAIPAAMLSIKTMLGKWEIIAPDIVNNGK